VPVVEDVLRTSLDRQWAFIASDSSFLANTIIRNNNNLGFNDRNNNKNNSLCRLNIQISP